MAAVDNDKESWSLDDDSAFVPASYKYALTLSPRTSFQSS